MTDKRTTEFAVLSTATADDLLPILDDPAGTPTLKSITLTNFLASTALAASAIQSGFVELATTAEINTGTDTTRAVSIDQFVASNRNLRYFIVRFIDAATDWSANGTTKINGAVPFPFTGTIVSIKADADTAGTTGTAIVDCNLNGTTIMSANKLKWDSTEVSTSTYSGTAPGITTTAVTAGDLISVDIDTNHTTKSKGLVLTLGVRMT